MKNTREIFSLLNKDLMNPFPYEDAVKIQHDYKDDFNNIPEEKNCLTGDFNTYCMDIYGLLARILIGNKIPMKNIDYMKNSFFELFPQYKFLEDGLEKYENFNKEFNNYENVRKTILKVFLTT